MAAPQVLQPIKWKSGKKKEFLHWIQHELHETMGDRHDLQRKWQDNIVQWRAQLPEESHDGLFIGASDVEFPLTAIHSDPVYADLFQTLHAPEDYFTAVAKRADRAHAVNSIRKALTAVEQRYIHMKRVNRKALLDMVIHGTAVYKNHWHVERKTIRDYDRTGEIIDRLILKSHPKIEHVPLQRFYFPAAAWSLDPDAQGGAQWTAQEFYVTQGQLAVWAQGGDNLPGFEKEALRIVQTWDADETPDLDRTIQEEDKYQPFSHRRIRLFEVQARFDVDDDGIEEDVVCILHLDALVGLRFLHPPFFHGKRTHHVATYLPSQGIYGIGMSEIDAWAQETCTKLLNAQLDNVLLANTRMWGVPQGSGIQPGEPVYPGKQWFLGPDERIQEIRMADVYPSIFQSLGQMMQFAESRTGMPEIRQGNLSSLPSRTPATSLLSLLREGNKRFDMILSGFRDVHAEMGLRMLQNLSQYFHEDPEKWIQFFAQAIGEKPAMEVAEVLMGSIHGLEETFGIQVTATSAQVNKEVEKQSMIGLMQIVVQIYEQLIQTAMLIPQAPDPMTQETAVAAYKAGVELLEQLLERFDIQNPQEYLPNLEALAAQGGGGGGGMPMQQGGGGGMPPGAGGGMPGFGP